MIVAAGVVVAVFVGFVVMVDAAVNLGIVAGAIGIVLTIWLLNRER